MNRETHLKLLEEKMAKNLDVAKRKNQDYCGKNEDSDPFVNFRLAEKLSNGKVSTEYAIFTRMTDKIARIGTLLSQDAQVNDESIQDTLGDLSNYALILSNYLDSKKSSNGSSMDGESDDTDLFYKIGDSVKILNANGASSELVGTIGTVKFVHDTYCTVYTQDGNFWSYTFAQLEPV